MFIVNRKQFLDVTSNITTKQPQEREVNTMQINVETKFNIGQEVYIIQKARSKEPCAACNGEGHIIIDGNRFSCDKCFGTGRLHGKRKIHQLAGKDIITNIKVYNYLLNTGGHHNESKTVVKYGFADRSDYTEQKLFATQEEAETRCNELNKEAQNEHKN